MKLETRPTVAAASASALRAVPVLPAEYKIVPTGLGGVMGLTGLARDGTATAPFEGVLAFNVAEYDPTAERIDISVQGLIALEDAPFRCEVIEIEEAAGYPEGFEMPYRKGKGQVRTAPSPRPSRATTASTS